MEKLTEITNDKDGSALVLIPEGEFLMGSDDGYPSERPAHRVFVSAFYIAKNLVTNAQYQRFILETGHEVPYMDDPRAEWANWDRDSKSFRAGYENHPVVLTGWVDAMAYCWNGREPGWLPKPRGKGFARGGLEEQALSVGR